MELRSPGPSLDHGLSDSLSGFCIMKPCLPIQRSPFETSIAGLELIIYKSTGARGM